MPMQSTLDVNAADILPYSVQMAVQLTSTEWEKSIAPRTWPLFCTDVGSTAPCGYGVQPHSFKWHIIRIVVKIKIKIETEIRIKIHRIMDVENEMLSLEPTPETPETRAH